MQSNPHKRTVIDGETLMDKRLPPTKFCVDTLLPQGLCILGGSPKAGKSWLVLDLCVHVAQGTPLWGLDVTRGEVLYLCERRIQERLNTITDNIPDGMYFDLHRKRSLRLYPSVQRATPGNHSDCHRHLPAYPHANSRGLLRWGLRRASYPQGACRRAWNLPSAPSTICGR